MLGQELGGRGSPLVGGGCVGCPEGAQVSQPLPLQQELALQLLLLLGRHLGRIDLRTPRDTCRAPQEPRCLAARGTPKLFTPSPS